MGNLGGGTTLNIECVNSSEREPFRTSNPPQWRKAGIHCCFNLGLLPHFRDCQWSSGKWKTPFSLSMPLWNRYRQRHTKTGVNTIRWEGDGGYIWLTLHDDDTI